MSGGGLGLLLLLPQPCLGWWEGDLGGSPVPFPQGPGPAPKPSRPYDSAFSSKASISYPARDWELWEPMVDQAVPGGSRLGVFSGAKRLRSWDPYPSFSSHFLTSPLLFTLLSFSSPHPWALPLPPGADEVPAQHVRSAGLRDAMCQSSAWARSPLIHHLDPRPSLPQGERAGDATCIRESLRR